MELLYIVIDKYFLLTFKEICSLSQNSLKHLVARCAAVHCGLWICFISDNIVCSNEKKNSILLKFLKQIQNGLSAEQWFCQGENWVGKIISLPWNTTDWLTAARKQLNIIKTFVFFFFLLEDLDSLQVQRVSQCLLFNKCRDWIFSQNCYRQLSTINRKHSSTVIMISHLFFRRWPGAVLLYRKCQKHSLITNCRACKHNTLHHHPSRFLSNFLNQNENVWSKAGSRAVPEYCLQVVFDSRINLILSWK